MIKKNYILLVHKEPFQLRRLIEKLNDSNSLFFIHIDLKSDIQPFEKIINLKNVVFIKERVNAIWGDYAQVVAMLNLLRNVLQRKNSGRIIFLSGQDYPIKSKNHIENYLKKNANYEFIGYDEMPEKMYNERVEKYRFNLSDKRGDYIILPPVLRLTMKDYKTIIYSIFFKKLNPLNLLAICTKKRKFKYKKHYKGTNWWSFRFDTAEMVYHYYLKNKNYLDNYYKHTHCADEQFFHTILKEIMKIHPKIETKPILHFIDWNRKNVSLPVTFKKEDVSLLLEQKEDKLFARKFNYNIELLNILDKKIS